jgi:hypothetical protein
MVSKGLINGRYDNRDVTEKAEGESFNFLTGLTGRSSCYVQTARPAFCQGNTQLPWMNAEH